VLEPQTRRLLALLLTRAAAGLGGALAGIGLVHIAVAGNPWGIPLLVIGLVMLLQGIRRAAQLDNPPDA
jgi:hypothetical protein